MNNLVYTNILSNEVLQMRSNSVNDNGWKQNTNSFRVVPLYSFSGSTMSEKRSAITENCGFEVVKTSTLKKQNRKRGRPRKSPLLPNNGKTFNCVPTSRFLIYPKNSPLIKNHMLVVAKLIYHRSYNNKFLV